jgi:hypothetical protein
VGSAEALGPVVCAEGASLVADPVGESGTEAGAEGVTGRPGREGAPGTPGSDGHTSVTVPPPGSGNWIVPPPRQGLHSGEASAGDAAPASSSNAAAPDADAALTVPAMPLIPDN